MPTTSQELSRRLRAAREATHLTQEEAARRLGVSRPTLTQIELGNRPVTSVELSKLAHLYGRDVREFLAETFDENETLAALFRADTDAVSNADVIDRVRECLALARQLTDLESLLGIEREMGAVGYDMPRLTRKWDAIQQGEQVAEEERARLGLGWTPVPEITELLETQGVRTGVVDLPIDVSGLTLSHKSIGLFVVVNSQHVPARRRFSFAHEYAHVVMDRGRFGTISRESNRDDLLEVRANSFAACFLMPAEGVQRFVVSLGKGKPSRLRAQVFDGESATPVEGRPGAHTQAIQIYDVAHMAHHFGVSRLAALYRLLNLGLLNQAEFEPLKSAEEDNRAQGIAAALELLEPDDAPSRNEFRHRFLNLALEAFRRGEISRAKLNELAAMVSMPPHDLDRLLEDAGLSERGGVGVGIPKPRRQ